MKKIAIVNNGMGETSFGILLGSVKRALELRECELVSEDADYTVTVSVNGEYRSDRYTVRGRADGANVVAANDPAVHAAVGRLLRKSKFDGKGIFVPFVGEIDHTPEKSIRGMYFATHFYNFYHVAPIEKVYEVIEDLALRGCNCIETWFDMHHYNSTKEEEAQEIIARLRAIIKYTNDIGMMTSMTMNSNEAFANSPEHLRARWDINGRYFAEPHGHYHVELCPSKEGGIEKIIEYRREVFECFADLRIDYVVYWPYDQGGCSCPECQPWGSNGFLKLFPHYKALVNEVLPNTKVVVSTWYFDKFVSGEWDEFYERLDEPMFEGVEYIMAFFHNGNIPSCIKEKGLPKGREFIDFPEISMQYCSPWGGYGASVLTGFLDRTNKACEKLYQGGFPYSEGIYEDANKFIEMEFYNGTCPDAYDALREYVKYEFCCEDEELYEAVKKTETALHRRKDPESNGKRYVIQDTSDIDFVYNTIMKYNDILPEKITSSRNFRLFYLRAIIDYEMKNHDFVPSASPRCTEAMNEVNRIYYANERTRSCVCAPIGVLTEEQMENI